MAENARDAAEKFAEALLLLAAGLVFMEKLRS